ncbi:MAG TPA: acylphosphatase [Gemmatimonadales bacterium]
MKAVTGRRFLVSGDVQGVGYRRFAQRAALGLGLTGWVRNRPDGQVEVEARGPAEAIDRLAAILEAGPSGAYVTKVESIEISGELSPLSGFHISR